MMPRNPVAAVTHPEPYAYYALLAARQPFYRDEALGLWVAAGAGAAKTVLTSPICHVRPPHEPVPQNIVGSPAGKIFRHLIRMRDDGGHGAMKAVIVKALAAVQPQVAERTSMALAVQLARDVPIGSGLADFAFHLPVRVVASLLGFSEGDLARIALLLTDFVAGLSPLAGSEAVEAAQSSAAPLLEEMGRHLETGEKRSILLHTLRIGARAAGCFDAEVLAANAIGLMMQSQEATAGLIGAALVALTRDPDLRLSAEQDGAVLASIVDDVLRRDPPIQNTRRFVAEDGEIAGQAVRCGDGILVVLATAQSEREGSSRPGEAMLAFGEGRHACPARALATTIARAGVAQALERGLVAGNLGEPVFYRPSLNARIPL